MLEFISLCQIKIFIGSLPRLLDESMQQHHPASLVDIEKHTGDSVLSQISPHLMNAIAQGSANGHPDGPAELHGLDIFTNQLAILI